MDSDAQSASTSSSTTRSNANRRNSTNDVHFVLKPFYLNTISEPKKLSDFNTDELSQNYYFKSKRKRRATSDACTDYVKDPEIGHNPPLAKRPQLLPPDVALVYGSDQSNVSSVASSLFTSPVDSEIKVPLKKLHSNSSSEDLRDSAHKALPDSPYSPNSLPCSPGYCVALRLPAKTYMKQTTTAVDADDEHDFSNSSFSEDDDEDQNDDDIDSTNSSITSSQSFASPVSTGERTPGHASTALNSNGNGSRCSKPVNQMFARQIDDYAAKYKCMSPAVESPLRQCPLPALAWANAPDVWKKMCQRDEKDARLRSSNMLERHPGLQPRMRAILLDWLIEVCEVYKLHRETYYLAVDFLDRYLHEMSKVQKTHLQLIGITCLFVAAKVEEIYPPKIGEFAYVTDGACTEKDILQHEKLLLQALKWETNPLTAIGWLGVYMQLHVNNRTPESLNTIATQAGHTDDAFIFPQYSGFEFVQTAQLLDLCTLDVRMADYSYSVLAAAAISHTFSRETALRSSGLDWTIIEPCARWMTPFLSIISKRAPYLQLSEQNEQVTNKFGLAHVCPNIVTDDTHIIQTHTTNMDMYDELLVAQDAMHAERSRTQASPATGLRAPENLLTPPASSHKPDDFLADEEEAATAAMVSSSSSLANRGNIALKNGGSSSSSNKTSSVSGSSRNSKCSSHSLCK